MHAFAMGYAVVLAVAAMVWAVELKSRQGNGPIDWIRETPWFALIALGVFTFGWLLVAGSLSQPKQFDARAKFRAADPLGWWSTVAGILSGVVAIGIIVLAHSVFKPTGGERDLNTIRTGIVSFASIALSGIFGARLFLAVFRPRSEARPR